MKVSGRVTSRIPPQTKKKVRGYSKHIYKAHKEVSPAAERVSVLLAGRFRLPRPVLLRLVSSEASRLSKSNRLKVISVQEVNGAITLLRQRIHTRDAA